MYVCIRRLVPIKLCLVWGRMALYRMFDNIHYIITILSCGVRDKIKE
jgi:hypothetical protein